MTAKGPLVQLLAILSLLSAHAAGAAVELSSEEMSEVVGGVTITNFVSPADGTLVSLDNPVITADFEDLIEDPEIQFEARTPNGAKIASQTVTTTGFTGRFSAPAFDFPLLGQTTDVSITYNDGEVPDGDRTATGLRINPAIDVPVVMVHRLVDSVGGPSVPQFLPFFLFDFPALEPFPLTDVLGLDALLAQCSTNGRIQIRASQTVNTVSVPDDCSRPNLITDPNYTGPFTTCLGFPEPVPQVPGSGPGVIQFYENLANSLGPNFFHVFLLDDLVVGGTPIGGVSFGVETGLGRNYSLVVNQTQGFLQVFGRTILHEFLHTRRLGHPDQPQSQQMTTIAVPSANNCGFGGGGQAGENIMCRAPILAPDPFDTTPTAGLTAAQCDVARSFPNRATDFAF